ncbi:PREDICTED: putative nuclease HARBI1 [Priapulus caudatus]|uniref:Putative nuclease HARBI1 n=1 Tax=Priapulus caudatus TaxID=37621 RepID=A0ABM1E453_PRICU|nr:PREDICTED: putative nuclease HARBI1 [Priapulus caudatus]XP_014666972.1 PREDICTED: putative nuclease HARBI1 [Priapulus caudatus]XP_014666973.1 PREDICTED: putative nuclease HARBI1 [Priapulus caudatus]XP_014666974.1 PREDICTED: putative nuclease HARBI1 [Priapulus caudatus]
MSLANGSHCQHQDRLAEIKVGFYRKWQFPGVIGCVDGTHVAIRTPPRNEDVFVCRKGFHSINIMLIDDHKNRITAVSARFPGSSHDMAVFDCSNIQQRMENGDLENKGLLLADSGYALRPYLMTPVLRPHNDQEVRYNAAHKGTRVSIEQANGILKSRFRCLDRSSGGLFIEAGKACKAIVACCVLHMCITFHDVMVEMLPNDVHNDDVERCPELDVNGRIVRDNLIRNAF